MVTDFKFEERRARTTDGSPVALADQIERFGRAMTATQLTALLSVFEDHYLQAREKESHPIVQGWQLRQV